MDAHGEQLKKAREAFQEGRWKDAIAALQAVLDEDPNCQEARDLLAEVEFRQGLDKRRRVRARRFIIPWRKIGLYVGIIALLALALNQGMHIYRNQLVPSMQAAQTENYRQALLRQAQTNYTAGNLVLAQENLAELLSQVPDQPEALALLDQIESDLALQAKYDMAVAAEEEGDTQTALELYVELTVQRPGYRDVSQRIAAIRSDAQRNTLFAEAEQAREEGDLLNALGLYQQVQELDASYSPETIRSRIYEMHLAIAQSIMTKSPPDVAGLPDAQRHYEQALVLYPRDKAATEGKELVDAFLEGQQDYYEGRWSEAVRALQRVFEMDPSFVHDSVVDMLYRAYVNMGDDYLDAGDVAMAYAAYSDATGLPINDEALAKRRMADLVPLLTPTVTPSPTATPTVTPTWAPPATATPEPTPRPLAAYHNMIVFLSDDEDNPGYWVVSPDGSNRTFVGRSSTARKEYEAIKEQQAFSPDGKWELLVQNVNQVAQIFVLDPPTQQFPNPEPWQLTKLSGLCYDPAWAPDGSWIAFVSQAGQSDDIWLIKPDGSGARNLTDNKWEWDKSPSWSPDSQRVTFWSNRDGHKQVYVTDLQGRNVVNVSQSEYNDYDPIWIP